MGLSEPYGNDQNVDTLIKSYAGFGLMKNTLRPNNPENGVLQS